MSAGDVGFVAAIVSCFLWICLTYEILKPDERKRRYMFWGLFSLGTLSTFVVTLTLMKSLSFW